MDDTWMDEWMNEWGDEWMMDGWMIVTCSYSIIANFW